MAGILSERPGVLRKLRPYGAKLGSEIAIPHEFSILFPDDWRRSADQWDDRERSAIEAVAVLAEDVKVRPLDEQVEVLAGSDEEAADAGLSYPRLTPLLAQYLAESNAEPLAWVSRCVPDGRGPDGWSEVEHRHDTLRDQGHGDRSSGRSLRPCFSGRLRAAGSCGGGRTRGGSRLPARER